MKTRQTTTPRDPEAERAIEARLRSMFQHMSDGAWDELRNYNDDAVSYFDFGEERRPMQWYGRVEVDSAIDLWKRQELMGAHMQLNIERLDSQATSDYGVCATEFNFTVTMAGQIVAVVPARGTCVFRREGDQWLVVHWHGSTREVPPMPAAPTPGANG